MHKLSIGQKVYFENDKLPYTVMATSQRYAVVSRKAHRRNDADLFHDEVERGAYHTFTEAYNALKTHPVYSLLDFEEQVMGPDDLVFGIYDYFDEGRCRRAIEMLEAGGMGISSRNRCCLCIDQDKTFPKGS